MTVSLFLAKLKQQEASLFLSIRQTWCDCNSANQSRAAEVKPCYYSHVSSVIWSKWVFRFLHHRGQETDKSCPVCCLYIWPPVHCSSFTQTLILLHTSVRLHQYGEDEAALACCCCFSLFPVSFLSLLFFFFFLNPQQQRNRADDSVSALLHINLNLSWWPVWGLCVLLPLSWGWLMFTSCNWTGQVVLPPDLQLHSK